MSAGPTGTASGRSLGMVAALLGAALVLVAVLGKAWWHVSDKYTETSVGVTAAESCYQGDEDTFDGMNGGVASRAFGHGRCVTTVFSTKLAGKYRWFVRFGQMTFYGGIGTALLLLSLAGLILSGAGPRGRRSAVMLVRMLGCATLIAGIAFVVSRPERGHEDKLSMSYGFPLLVVGTLLGLGGSQALLGGAGSREDRGLQRQAAAGPGKPPAEVPADEVWPAPWPGQTAGPRGDGRSRPGPTAAPPRLAALPLALLGPPCGRCAAPTRWVPDYTRWHCDRCRSYI